MPIPASASSISSLPFLAFTILVLAAYYLLARRSQTTVLWLASLIFCAAWGPAFVLVVLASSMVNYLAALGVGAGGRAGKVWLLAGIAINLLGLLVFKYLSQLGPYAQPVLESLQIGLPPSVIRIIQPIGISFYTLQAISYLLDVRRGQVKPNPSFIEVSLYLAYFPKLLAGPIERAGHFFGQLKQQQTLDNAALAEAFVKILVGFVRKLAIADAISALIPKAYFDDPAGVPPAALLFWWIAFVFVIYNDFAGYSSIARGVSELFGLRLPANFEQPFFSTGTMDFWNRWHISLSHWMRDYLYLPLSRAMLRRRPSGRYLPNLVVPPLVTMAASGLWHGGIPHFMFWGMLNGALQGLERVYRSRVRISAAPRARWRVGLSILLTFVTIVLISAPFVMEIPETFIFWAALLNWGGPLGLTLAGVLRPLLAIMLSFTIDFGSLPARDETGWLARRQTVQVAALAAGLLLLFLVTRQRSPVPFIYQEF